MSASIDGAGRGRPPDLTPDKRSGAALRSNRGMGPRSPQAAQVPPLRKILLVDHAVHTRSIMGFVLGRIDRYELVTCSSGAEALAAVSRFKPDLVLLDIGMPGMDGIATLERLRAGGVTAPVIFFTSHVLPADLERYAALDIIGIVPKPFDPLKVPLKVEEMWRRHHLTAKV